MEDSRRRSFVTVLLAGGANLLIAVAKLAAGLVSGSSAMLSEGAHSVADTLNQAFLMTALQRSERPADEGHPFGYGKERYFWSLLAAVAVFVLGAGFSVLQGVSALVHGSTPTDPRWAYAALAVAFLFDGGSLLRAQWQIRREHTDAESADTTVRAVLFEDAAGVAGVVLAAIGLVVDQIYDTDVGDALASLAIAALLIAVAFALGRRNRDLLIGQAVSRDVLSGIRDQIRTTDGVHSVLEVLTMQLGPDDVLLAARVALDQNTPAGDAEQVADRVEDRVRSSYPQVRHVFVDPTPERPVEHVTV